MRFYTKIKMRVFLIRKRIFRFFTKIQKRTIDPIDPQRRWILWIISKTRYFGYMIRRVSLLRIRKECGNSKPFKYIHVHQLFDRTHLSLRSFLNRSHGLNDGSYPFYRVSKMAIQTGPALFKLQEKKCYNTSPSRLARLYFSITCQYISYFKTGPHFSPPKTVS